MSPPAEDLGRSGFGGFLVHPEEEEILRDQIAASPDPPSLFQFLTRYQTKNGLPSHRQQLLALTTLAGQSPFLGELLLQSPESLAWAVGQLGKDEPRSAEGLREDLARFRFTFSQLSDAAVLRRFKLREYLRIALRDFFGKADLSETTQELSLLADVLLQGALLITLRENLNRFGPPQFIDDSGRICEATFAILSLGKLGGGELNYSSDIDLIYVYSREGQTAGREDDPHSVIGNREFFSRVGEGITQRIGGISPEGQVFRVDLGLRPGGRDGELVHSQRSLLAYYRTWAHNWEKQALIKARHSAGDPSLGESVVRELKKRIDPSGSPALVALEIKEMKDRIDEELSRTGRGDLDLKLGRGGIRELEFGVQALQMTHGQMEPWVHEGNTLRALHRLADKDLVTYTEHASLDRAYTFLRKVEHCLQLERNRQTYLLPSEAAPLKILARRMGFLEKQSTEALLRELEHHREAVRNFYDRVFGFLSQPSLEGTDPDPLLDPLPEHTLSALVGRPGASGAEESLRLFKRIRRIFSSEQIRPSERRGVRRVSSSILEEVTSAPEPNRVFSNLERFLSSLLLEPTARRAFFEKAEWIPPLIRLLAKSEHLALVLTGHPQILEELGNVPDALRDASFEDLAAPLERDLKNTAELREVAALLRRFHRRQVLFTGLRDVHRQDSLSRTLRRLTALAQACLVGAERAASKIAPAAKQEPRFCVLGLGRLGYHELDYNSDLDLIFVMEPTDDSAALENSRRRAESLIHLLTAITQDGTLYSVDLRLRPAGGEGELIQTSNGLQDYFRDSAQTWEKMALLKARPVAGDVAFGRELLLSLEETMFRGIRQSCLGAEVREMKEKLELSVGGKGGEGLSLKLGPGGLLEVHFIIEYLQLWHGVPGPNDRDTLRMLTYLHGRQLLPAADYHALYAAYLLLRSLDHSIRVLYDRPGDSLPLSRNHLARLASEVSYTLSSSQEATADSLLELVHESCASVRAAFHRLIP